MSKYKVLESFATPEGCFRKNKTFDLSEEQYNNYKAYLELVEEIKETKKKDKPKEAPAPEPAKEEPKVEQPTTEVK